MCSWGANVQGIHTVNQTPVLLAELGGDESHESNDSWVTAGRMRVVCMYMAGTHCGLLVYWVSRCIRNGKAMRKRDVA